ncbi:hypothetical protein LHL20_03300 [Alteromonas sp. McT4-15]|uniref:hypothetical protein n=1 Tax=Alteromonas sp. McT4-15 TaxID=2881256 RepID=UPI001CF8FCD6|nr:hypothetical protein [Alteromonas sp. McT4-15]MCB4435268.1 hypothetical protein [Alteromonas sp. McT4-15]
MKNRLWKSSDAFGALLSAVTRILHHSFKALILSTKKPLLESGFLRYYEAAKGD